jgi:methylenetetrahydrofolate dehydrogenase (NADP+)/methenyltetrahydrofolate cyclohydrolase
VSATIMDGKALAARIRKEVAREVAELGGELGLATVLVGDDPASHVYIASKHKAAGEAGMHPRDIRLSQDTTEEDVLAQVAELNADESVDGILVQLPLPGDLDSKPVLELIDPSKDVDGFHPVSVGRLVANQPGLRPCTPAGVMELLKAYDVPVTGADAVVVGRSDIVGKPVALLLLHQSATVTIAHSKTRDLAEVTRRADILVAAVGRPKMITGDMVKPGAAVIDVGINRTDEGVVGDVDYASASQVAGAITPVPGGVGPMTIAMLLSNTLQAVRLRRSA